MLTSSFFVARTAAIRKTSAALVLATDGSFYGTTYGGGSGTPPEGSGTVFSISREGKLTTLYGFNRKQGIHPVNALLQATNGNFYGLTPFGGSHDHGTVFRLSMGLGPFVTTRPNVGKIKTKVLILGNNVTDATSVTFNGTAVASQIVSSTEIKTTVPAGATTGAIEVTTGGGTLKAT
jgi:uncharacterized repeat protein (TIGR03803 family)